MIGVQKTQGLWTISPVLVSFYTEKLCYYSAVVWLDAMAVAHCAAMCAFIFDSKRGVLWKQLELGGCG